MARPRYVIMESAELDFYGTSSLKQQSRV